MNSSSLTDPCETVPKRRKDAAKHEEASRASVIKSPVAKRAKSIETQPLDCISDKPTGIFMPTEDLEIPPVPVALKTCLPNTEMVPADVKVENKKAADETTSDVKVHT